MMAAFSGSAVFATLVLAILCASGVSSSAGTCSNFGTDCGRSEALVEDAGIEVGALQLLQQEAKAKLLARVQTSQPKQPQQQHQQQQQQQQEQQQQQQHQQQLQQPPQMQLQRHPSVPAIAVSTPPMSTRGLLWQYQPGASSSPLSARGLAAAVTAGGRATPMRSAPVVPVTTGRRQAAPQQRPAWVGGPTVRGGGVSGSGHQSPVRPDMPRLPFQGGTVSPRHRSVSPVPNQGYPNGARSRTAR
mmetsp:Transcript_60024/g.194646  ORF Transcript_60024/g.194646 Transcript_60024/m.194646 type:complete len:245 (+) Transcript_60024:84-818(+)